MGSRDVERYGFIGSPFQLNCNRIKTTKGNLKISEKGSKPLRVGVAVRQKGQDGCVSSRIPGLATSNQELC